MGYNEDIPSVLIGGVVLRDDASLVKALTEPQTETCAIELAALSNPPRVRALIVRFWDLVALR